MRMCMRSGTSKMKCCCLQRRRCEQARDIIEPLLAFSFLSHKMQTKLDWCSFQLFSLFHSLTISTRSTVCICMAREQHLQKAVERREELQIRLLRQKVAPSRLSPVPHWEFKGPSPMSTRPGVRIEMRKHS